MNTNMNMNTGNITMCRMQEDNLLVNIANIETIEEINENGKLFPIGYILHMTNGNTICITPKDYGKIISDIEIKY